MDFRQFEYVKTIAEEKSISRAAERLYISQPSLSQYIIRLENSLGVKLFDRTSATITLTFAGEKYIETARNIINLNNQLTKELNDIANLSKGRVIIGVPSQAGRYILPLVIPKFYKEYPNIEIIVEENIVSELEKMLLEGKIDIAILTLPVQHEKITYESIMNERIFLIAPKKHPICSVDGRISFNFIRNEKFILLKKGQRIRLIVDDIFSRIGAKPNIILEITNLDAAYRMASSGMGFTIVPENVLYLLNTNGKENDFIIDSLEHTLVVAYRKGEYLTRASREFIANLKGVMKMDYNNKNHNSVSYKKIYID
ncbi:DNA-binding transcriptional LysR family regulator [Clostridium acetobutylicum]|uniref:Transcriptional regulator, LysR family n=1 Tax=Clostridium acetobutylicum (strain ATCC 824 / DSM 792 / JCM 1419 / IAM 19013 / LMG 5710 / NBRC 13948 / NRRL B-527 / VKM B-1787 / 2291 / W) TaxID=272562 RepID=Q97DV9_CLOAB|nr:MULTISPECIES: LysR family transcriptional regulator [Clostridium]AAK81293.1 Transcriptional regulator, LysR family [Clostridium acetobutylicum ATCC 824]ADZ22401.1 Transcriptional regulator, LysR family [Clostridium acetobutylicum EA 2018]AEI32795.1 LysR family transcriptional regulator [Clostridium acetobutylicum DSM 1731]AWV81040.1 LysR family transcriptional regulator [Clostridium acetobutylicum]MBC2395554.1 LysR family transcriptional regulator [Clostridium acetobutylicum]